MRTEREARGRLTPGSGTGRQRGSDVSSLAPLAHEVLDVVLEFDCLVLLAVPADGKDRCQRKMAGQRGDK